MEEARQVPRHAGRASDSCRGIAESLQSRKRLRSSLKLEEEKEQSATRARVAAQERLREAEAGIKKQLIESVSKGEADKVIGIDKLWAAAAHSGAITEGLGKDKGADSEGDGGEEPYLDECCRAVFRVPVVFRVATEEDGGDDEEECDECGAGREDPRLDVDMEEDATETIFDVDTMADIAGYCEDEVGASVVERFSKDKRVADKRFVWRALRAAEPELRKVLRPSDYYCDDWEFKGEDEDGEAFDMIRHWHNGIMEGSMSPFVAVPFRILTEKGLKEGRSMDDMMGMFTRFARAARVRRIAACSSSEELDKLVAEHTRALDLGGAWDDDTPWL